MMKRNCTLNIQLQVGQGILEIYILIWNLILFNNYWCIKYLNTFCLLEWVKWSLQDSSLSKSVTFFFSFGLSGEIGILLLKLRQSIFFPLIVFSSQHSSNIFIFLSFIWVPLSNNLGEILWNSLLILKLQNQCRLLSSF